jgi:tetratricopeptide (TPR) repeat protein
LELRDRLQTTLGSAYTLERELGGGGMSRVFVARETALNRDVVVKVLPPDLVAGVNVERFKREIQLAAALQHPHIVHVLSAGEMDSIPYYTMPFVQGESLRTRLSRGGPLPIAEAVGILRDVSKALAYAHERNVVHRDIKPDNVLITGGVAVVTDFGIAKAISAARTSEGSGTLTQMGTSLGTPAYMSPEQAAGDPGTNHRADIYAFGVMAYEMLGGRPPFHGRTPHKLLAAQMGERPRPVSELRADVPPLLADLVMRCLEKDPDDRPQAAADLDRVLQTISTGASQASTAAAVLLTGRVRLWRVLGVWATAFVAVFIVAKASIVGIGLPDWVLPGAVIVMLLGLPAILFTAFVHRTAHAAITRTPTLTPGGGAVPQGTLATIALKASPWVSWRRTWIGGAAAVGGFILLVGGFMLLRSLGIGPAKSLIAAGLLDKNERLIVADFKSPANDSLLGSVVTEALRTELSQSSAFSVIPATAMRDVLRRMEKPNADRVDFQLAREIATREGLKAIVDGEIMSLGGNYVLSARLMSTQNGEVLASFSENARDSSQIIPAIGKLSKDLRGKVGESLKRVQSAPPLEQVTTGSLEALKKYVQGSRAIRSEGQFAKGVSLLEEAIAIDTSFAMAYRRLATELNNQGGQRARATALMQKAFDHRDRLSDPERYLTTGTYYMNGPAPDAMKALSQYQALLDIQPDNTTALNNAAVIYMGQRNFVKAEEYLARAVQLSQSAAVYFNNLLRVQFVLGKEAEGARTLDQFAKSLPSNPNVEFDRSVVAYLHSQYDSADAIVRRLGEQATDVATREGVAFTRETYALNRGQLGAARTHREEALAEQVRRGVASAPLNAELDAAFRDVWYLSDPQRAVRAADAALARHPLDSLAPVERPYGQLAQIYSLGGQQDRARTMLNEFVRARTTLSVDEESGRHQILGTIALGEKRYDEAIREYRASDVGVCRTCALPDLGRAYDLAGQADSAIAVFNRYLTLPGFDRSGQDQTYLAGTYKRLGELYEAKGDRTKAIEHYRKFIDLWKNADRELQPKVEEARQRLTALQRAGG